MFTDKEVKVKEKIDGMWTKRILVTDFEFLYLFRLSSPDKDPVIISEIKYSKLTFCKEIKDNFCKKTNVLTVTDKSNRTYQIHFNNSLSYKELFSKLSNPELKDTARKVEKRLKHHSSMKVIPIEEPQPKQRMRTASMPKELPKTPTRSDKHIVSKIFKSNNGINQFSIAEGQDIKRNLFCSDEEILKETIESFKRNTFYYYDPAILESMVKSTTKEEKLVKLITLAETKETKVILLTYLLARLFVQMLEESFVNSLRTTLAEKEMHKDFIIGAENMHSLKANIVDLANQFVGQSDKRKEFIGQILPGVLEKRYELIGTASFLLNDFNECYFLACVQHVTRISFLDVYKLNFEIAEPLTIEFIHKIDPGLINSLFLAAYRKHCSSHEVDSSQGDTTKKKLDLGNLQVANYDNATTNYKQMHLFTDRSRINTISLIKDHVDSRRWELALDLCEYYLSSWGNLLFLNPQIFCYMAEIYYRLKSPHLARVLLNKAETQIAVLLGKENSFLTEILHNRLLLQLKFEDYGEEEMNSNVERLLYLNEKHYEPGSLVDVLVQLNCMLVKKDELKREDVQIKAIKLITQLFHLGHKDRATSFNNIFNQVMEINKGLGEEWKKLIKLIH